VKTALKSVFVASCVTAAGAAALTHLGRSGDWVAGQAGARALAEGRTADAVALLERSSTRRPDAVTRYNLGAALLEADRPADAAHELESSLAGATAPELRWRILHNLALARLRQALAAGPGARTPAALAAGLAARDALRLAPDREEPRRTLALAQRLVTAPSSESRAEAVRDSGGRAVPGSPRLPGATGSLTEAQARAILDALASAEAVGVEEILDRGLDGEDLVPKERRGPPW